MKANDIVYEVNQRQDREVGGRVFDTTIELVGIFTSKTRAFEAARKRGIKIASATGHSLEVYDKGEYSVVEWICEDLTKQHVEITVSPVELNREY